MEELLKEILKELKEIKAALYPAKPKFEVKERNKELEAQITGVLLKHKARIVGESTYKGQ